MWERLGQTCLLERELQAGGGWLGLGEMAGAGGVFQARDNSGEHWGGHAGAGFRQDHQDLVWSWG